MKKTEVMKELKKLGKDTHRRTFARHGVTGDFYGVPYADLYKLQKKIGTDHRLAEQLWATGNHDARILATFIADGGAMKAATLDTWCKATDNPLMIDAIAGLASRSPQPKARLARWMKSKQEWVAAAGWHLLAAVASQDDGGGLADAEFASYLDQIERAIHTGKNRVKYSMNAALIAIAGRSPGLQKRAIAAARRIGNVEVDHGGTACKTPDAVPHILKVAARKQKGTAKKGTAKKSPTKKKAARKKTRA